MASRRRYRWLDSGAREPAIAGSAAIGLAALLVAASVSGATMGRLATATETGLVSRLARTLESRIPRAPVSGDIHLHGIIVLGGSATRVRAALELADRFPGAHLVLSGPGHSEVAYARQHVRRVARLTIDNRATNTYENAVYSKQLVAPRAGENWAVVTSAVHMPRALGAFQATGFHVLPWPIADTPGAPGARSAWVWHEIGGLIGYRIFGRTRDLYPRFTTATAPGDRPAT
jgi:uncharacterized SAM-binding protein YcdF (DUF218 family)